MLPADRPPVRAERGMVATPHHLATDTGADILRAGGSAVDAAIGANAVLCVSYPHMAGLGGDAFMLLADPSGQVRAINASGPAATLADSPGYREQVRTGIPARGPLAALTVPGAVDGWRLAHEAYGRLSWGRVLRDAVHHARRGVERATSLQRWLERDRRELREHQPAGSSFLPSGGASSRIQVPWLAETFERLAADGARRGFYEGETAARLDRACRRAGSPLRADDLAAYQAEWVEPLSRAYHGETIWQLPPNSQGVTALQLLGLLEPDDTAAWDDGTAQLLHRSVEAVKLAFADRDAWVADPRFTELPTDRLLETSYLDTRRAMIDPQRAAPVATIRSGIATSGPSAPRVVGGDTVYLCAVDDSGLSVSMIESLYHDFGSMFVAEGTGLLLQNRGCAFSLTQGHPNRLGAGRRPFHTLIPALVTDAEGRARLLYGSMGGDGQPQTQLQLLRWLELGLPVQSAIDAPRWLMGRTWGVPSRRLHLEAPLAERFGRQLTDLGHEVERVPAHSEVLGHAQMIRTSPSGFHEGGADPRGDGCARGW